MRPAQAAYEKWAGQEVIAFRPWQRLSDQTQEFWAEIAQAAIDSYVAGIARRPKRVRVIDEELRAEIGHEFFDVRENPPYPIQSDELGLINPDSPDDTDDDFIAFWYGPGSEGRGAPNEVEVVEWIE